MRGESAGIVEQRVRAAWVLDDPREEPRARAQLSAHLHQHHGDQHEEASVVPRPDAVVEPVAVVVKVLDALVASAAVLAPRAHVAVAHLAEQARLRVVAVIVRGVHRRSLHERPRGDQRDGTVADLERESRVVGSHGRHLEKVEPEHEGGVGGDATPLVRVHADATFAVAEAVETRHDDGRTARRLHAPERTECRLGPTKINDGTRTVG